MIDTSIEGEGYTLASLLRQPLFNNGATFASCTVSHPQSKSLDIIIDGDSPHIILSDSIVDVQQILRNCVKSIDSYIFNIQAMTDTTTIDTPTAMDTIEKDSNENKSEPQKHKLRKRKI